MGWHTALESLTLRSGNDPDACTSSLDSQWWQCESMAVMVRGACIYDCASYGLNQDTCYQTCETQYDANLASCDYWYAYQYNWCWSHCIPPV